MRRFENEHQILNDGIQAFVAATGLGMKVREAKAAQARLRFDAELEVEKGGRFTAEVKAADRLATLDQVKELAAHAPHRLVLVCPYAGREIREACRKIGLCFLDGAGNAWLEAPGFFVQVEGKPRPPRPAHETMTQVLRAPGLRILFLLLTRPDLRQANYRELARTAGVALGTVGPVLKNLEGRGLLRTDKHGRRRLTDTERLIDEWAAFYPVYLRPRLNPRRFAVPDNEWWKVARIEDHAAVWGGEPAAARLTGRLHPEMLTLYAPEFPTRLAQEHRFQATPQGRLEILRPFWPAGPGAAGPRDVAPALVVYADLLNTREPRNIEIAGLIRREHLAGLGAE